MIHSPFQGYPVLSTSPHPTTPLSEYNPDSNKSTPTTDSNKSTPTTDSNKSTLTTDSNKSTPTTASSDSLSPTTSDDSISVSQLDSLSAWYCSSRPQPATVGINRMWVCQKHRRRGVASRILDTIRYDSRCKII